MSRTALVSMIVMATLLPMVACATDIIFQQSDDTVLGTTYTLTDSPLIQPLGSGVGGLGTELLITASTSLDNNHQNDDVRIETCPTSDYVGVGCTYGNPYAFPSMATGTKSQVAFDLPALSFDPAKYYAIYVEYQGRLSFYGTSTANGFLQLRKANGTGLSPYNIAFAITGTSLGHGTGINSQSPLNASTTPACDVTLTVNYTVNPNTPADRLYHTLTRTSDPSNPVTFYESVSAGTATSTRNICLPQGSWTDTPYLVNTVTGTTFGGQSNLFYVFGTSTPLILPEDPQIPVGRMATSSPLGSLLGITVSSTIIDVSATSSFLGLFGQVFPFSLILDTVKLFNEIQNVAASSSQPVTLDFGAMGTGSVRVATTAVLTIADFGNLKSSPALVYIRTALEYGMWVMTAIAVPTMIFRGL